MKSKTTQPSIGPRIRTRRIQLGLTLSELSKRAGLSVAFLSELERNLSGVSLNTLERIATALQVSINYLVPGSGGLSPIRRPKQFERFVLQDSLVSYARMGRTDSEYQLEPLLLILPPRCAEHRVQHLGEAFVLVMQGKLKLCIKGQKQVLRNGDTAHFKMGDPYTWHNPTDKEVRLVWVGTPRMF